MSKSKRRNALAEIQALMTSLDASKVNAVVPGGAARDDRIVVLYRRKEKSLVTGGLFYDSMRALAERFPAGRYQLVEDKR